MTRRYYRSEKAKEVAQEIPPLSEAVARKTREARRLKVVPPPSPAPVPPRRTNHMKGNSTGLRSDPLVVPSQHIADILEERQRIWERERPNPRRNHPDLPHDPVVGFINWLSFESGVSERVLRTIRRAEYLHLEFKVAEKILLALDLQHLLSNGDIPVVPNPKWSQETWLDWKEKQGCI